MKHILNFYEFINEGISANNMEKALELILKYLSKKVGPLYKLPGFQTIKKKTGPILVGITYLDKNGDGIRFNWDFKGTSSEVHSIDFFSAENLFSVADVVLTLNGESLARILPAVVQIHQKRTPNIKIDDFVVEAIAYKHLEEGRTPGAKNKSTLAKAAKGELETDVTPSLKKAQAELDNTKYADPETIFDDVDAYVNMVIKRIQPSLIVCGGPGIGKTYGITKKIKDSGLREIEPIEVPDDASLKDLEEMGINPQAESEGDWVHIKGASTAYTMYVNLFKYKNKLIVFDDCDSVFRDKDGVNVLKGALDSGSKRTISWSSKATIGKNAVAPPRFGFKGRIIFISNWEMKNINDAIRNRSFVVDINLKLTDVIKRIQTILPNIGTDLEVPLTMEAKKRALAFLQEAVDSGNKMEISIRTLVNFAKIAQSGIPQWRRLMEIQAQNI